MNLGFSFILRKLSIPLRLDTENTWENKIKQKVQVSNFMFHKHFVLCVPNESQLILIQIFTFFISYIFSATKHNAKWIWPLYLITDTQNFDFSSSPENFPKTNRWKMKMGPLFHINLPDEWKWIDQSEQEEDDQGHFRHFGEVSSWEVSKIFHRWICPWMASSQISLSLRSSPSPSTVYTKPSFLCNSLPLSIWIAREAGLYWAWTGLGLSLVESKTQVWARFVSKVDFERKIKYNENYF